MAKGDMKITIEGLDELRALVARMEAAAARMEAANVVHVPTVWTPDAGPDAWPHPAPKYTREITCSGDPTPCKTEVDA